MDPLAFLPHLEGFRLDEYTAITERITLRVVATTSTGSNSGQVIHQTGPNAAIDLNRIYHTLYHRWRRRCVMLPIRDIDNPSSLLQSVQAWMAADGPLAGCDTIGIVNERDLVNRSLAREAVARLSTSANTIVL